jgi:hypothetical protein
MHLLIKASRFSRLGLLAVMAFFVLADVALVAQERYGELNGTASDRSNAVVPGVTVTATNNVTNRANTLLTGHDGKYIFRDLAPGRYTVRFETAGFVPVEYADVIILAGKVLTLNAPLEVGGGREMVVVTGQTPLIDTTTTLVGQNVTQEEFDRLPKARSFQSLANLTPSVNTGSVVEGGIMVNGASGAENQFNVDGLSTNSLIEGQSRQDAAFEILEEVQVKTSGIEAQYGGALGGVISAITRSGGDKFHGDIHYYFSGSALNTRYSKRLIMDPVDLKTTTYLTDKEQPNSRHEAGYSLGGYFIPKKLYFFSAASPQWESDTRDYIPSDKTPVTLSRDTTRWQAYNKLSFDPTQKMRLTIGYMWSPTSAQGALGTYNSMTLNGSTSSASSLNANKVRGYFNPQSNYNASFDWTVTPTSMLNLKAARFWDNYKALGVLGQSAIEWGKPSVGLAGVPAELQQAQGYTTIPRVQTTQFDIATRTLFQADFSQFLKYAGGHDLKFGIGRQKNVNKVENSYPGGGYVTLMWNSDLTLPNGSTTRGQYGYYQVDDIGTKGTSGGTIDHIYFQDRWKVTRRLSVDAGLRLEKEVVPSFRRDIKEYAFEFGWGSKVAPRLGASFDLFGNGKVKLYGSWGRFYDWVKYELARGTFGGDVWRTYYRPLDSADPAFILKLGNGNMPGKNLWPTEFQDWRIPAFGSDQLDPNLQPMSTYIATGGMEWQLAPQLVFAARYTHNSLRNTIEDVGTMVNGSEYYLYGNPGKGLVKMSSPNTLTPSFELPTAKRVYDALELSFTRRFSNRWLASGSYVYSRLWGNYSGLQNTDEILPASSYLGYGGSQSSFTTTYRPGSSATRAWDLDYYAWDARGHRDVTGRLGADRPHVLKLYGSYALPKTLPFLSGETQIGAFFRAASGVPVSTLVQDVQRIPLFVNGRGDLGRTPIVSNTDLSFSHELKVGEGKTIRFEFNAQNIFNQRISQYTFSYYNRYRDRSAGMTMNNVDLVKGYDYKALVAASAQAKNAVGALDPRFSMADNISAGFSGRFGIKFSF